MWQRLLCRAARPTRDGGGPSAARPRLCAVAFLHHFGSAIDHHRHLHVCATNIIFMPTGGDVRCSEARVFRTPSHVKASFTAAILVRSLLAAERSCCVTGWWVSRWRAARRYVLAGVGGCCGRGGHWVRGISLNMGAWKARPRRLVAARTGKRQWLAPVFGAYDGLSAIDATMGPSATKSRNQGAKIPDELRASIGLG
jgi:hypothetical protein